MPRRLFLLSPNPKEVVCRIYRPTRRPRAPPRATVKAQTAPPEEVVYNPLKLDKLRTKSDVLKGVWTDPSRIPVLTRPEPNTWVRVRTG